MATAVKTPKSAIKSPREQADELLARYAEVSQLLDAQKVARRPLEEEYMQLRQQLQAWADDPDNDTQFGEGMTVKLAGGTIGYRLGPEKLSFILESELSEAQRTAAIVEACKKHLPAAVTVGYDAKYLIKGWAVLPKLQKALEDIVQGTVREPQFIITLK